MIGKSMGMRGVFARLPNIGGTLEFIARAEADKNSPQTEAERKVAYSNARLAKTGRGFRNVADRSGK
jgi:hypothetical protein